MNPGNLSNPNIVFEIAFLILHVHMYMRTFLRVCVYVCVMFTYTCVIMECNNRISVKAKNIILQLLI